MVDLFMLVGAKSNSSNNIFMRAFFRKYLKENVNQNLAQISPPDTVLIEYLFYIMLMKFAKSPM